MTLDLEALIHADREQRVQPLWQGTMLEYLELVKLDPTIVKLAHRRLYDAILEKGSRVLGESSDPYLQRNYQDSTLQEYDAFKDEFFGLELTLNDVMHYLHGAANRSEESRQVLFFLGPVGSGKSSLADKLSAILETSAPFYALDGCPMHEEPLHLVPAYLRQKFTEVLGTSIEGDPCPICRYRLEHEFNGEWDKFPVRQLRFNKLQRVGLSKVPPVDANNQDTAVLIGAEDISKLDKYSEDDPRVLSLTGAFNRGNRGITEMVEWFKNEIEFLHTAITATQEKVIPAPGRHGMIYVDTAIIAHSNESEWRRFKGDPTNEAILDRIVVIKVPYNLRLSEEIKIYEKMLRKSSYQVHIAPHTLEVAALFAIMTRLEPTPKCDLMTKLKLYNGEEVVGKRQELRELKADTKQEGMSGISTRFIQKAIDRALANSPIQILTPVNVRDELLAAVKATDLPDETKESYIKFLKDDIHKEYLNILEQEITKAFVYAYSDQAEDLFQNYLDHCEAFCNKNKVRDRVTREEREADLDFLKSIEEQIGIFGTAAAGFRQDVLAFIASTLRRQEKLDYTVYPPLREAIEKRLLTSVRDIARIITKARSRDPEQLKKYNNMLSRMLELGYTEASAEQVLTYASTYAWRD